MSGAEGLGRPETNSVTASQGSKRRYSNQQTGRTPLEELPTVDEVLAEVVNEYPHLVGLPLSEIDGQQLRGEVVDEEREQRVVRPEYRYDASFTKTEVRERRAVGWGEAVREFLEWYESYRYKTLKFGKGEPGSPDRETFSLEARNSWQPEYQTTEFARLKALERQTVGYDTCGECASYFCRRPAEHETAREPGAYEEPVVALITRSASSTPESEHVPPVEHDRALVEAWEPVYHTLRNRLRAAGFSREEWVYHRQGEPHEGGGAASAYGHEHTALIIDVAGHEHGVDEVEDLLRPVVDKHVEACEWAEEEAHGAEALEVKGVGEGEEEIRSPASYVAKYLSVDGGADLFERSPEYLMWGAVQWATGTQKGVRSVNANHAVSADLCTQDYHNPEESQVHRHGEFTRESAQQGHDRECAECGSPWGVDQEHGTNVERRLMADGGEVQAVSSSTVQTTLEAAMVAGPEPVDEELVDEVLGRPTESRAEEVWRDSRAGASYGETTKRVRRRRRIQRCLEENPDASSAGVAGALLLPPEADELVREVMAGEDSSGWSSYERPPEWGLEAVVDGRYRECLSCTESYEAHEGEECPRCGSEATEVRESPASPGHVDMRPLKLPEQRRRERIKAVLVELGGWEWRELKAHNETYEKLCPVEWRSYTCDCGATFGPAHVAEHVLGHGEEAPPERLAAMVQPASEARGAK